eukprot:TRINITY_DN44815_c0_g1_i1.p2 TRINITY_DN44815_c0_g1~~TRINITY_DN44815_c0_g1_i1.p2  ORF type:complete len:103 (-),score=3.74 TRINITY_DN44815_c0_g1_i1:131-439(-)
MHRIKCGCLRMCVWVGVHGGHVCVCVIIIVAIQSIIQTLSAIRVGSVHGPVAPTCFSVVGNYVLTVMVISRLENSSLGLDSFNAKKLTQIESTRRLRRVMFF